MKLYNTNFLLFPLVILLLAASCKEKRISKRDNLDLMQYYIAGKFTNQQVSDIPFAIIPNSPSKATFIWLNERREIDYTFEKTIFSTNIIGIDFTCIIKKSGIENISINSSILSVPIAALNKKNEASLAIEGKRFEGPVKKLDGGETVFQSYYFKFNVDQLLYSSNPTQGNYLINTKKYEKLVDGCFYSEQTNTFGVILNNTLEIESKFGNEYVLFSGQKL